MVDVKVSELPEITDLDPLPAEDLLLVVDDPTGTPTSKKIALNNFFNLLVNFNGIRLFSGTPTYSLSDATPFKLTCFNSGTAAQGTVVQANTPSDQLDVTVDGDYFCCYSVSLRSSLAGAKCRLKLNSLEQPESMIGSQQLIHFPNADELVAVSGFVLIALTNGLAVSLYAEALGASYDITVEAACLMAVRLGIG